MSSSLEDGTARRSLKVTERPSGLDEPLVLVLSGIGFRRNAEPGAFRLPRHGLPGTFAQARLPGTPTQARLPGTPTPARLPRHAYPGMLARHLCPGTRPFCPP